MGIKLRATIFVLIALHSCIISFAQPFVNKTVLEDTSALPGKGFFHSEAVHIFGTPVILFTASALTWSQREAIRETRNRYIPDFRHHYDDYLQYVPAATVFGLNAAGVKGAHSFKRTVASYILSAVIMGITVNAIKYTAKVERPDGSEKNSFPSGHTANSFMNATFLDEEYGEQYPLLAVAGYTMSTATAVGRGLNNRHWVSDILAGAGIGILSTRLGYLIADRIFKDKGNQEPVARNRNPISEKPSFIEMSVGYSTATSKDLTPEIPGLYAKNGFGVGVAGAWFFTKNIGIGAEYAFSSFPMDDHKLIFDDPDISVISHGHYTEPMGIRYLHVGPFFSFPLPYNWFITGKFTVGSSSGAQGDVVLLINDDYQDVFKTSELPYLQYKPETAFSWSTGMGIEKRIGRNVAIKAFANYFDSDHDFKVDILSDIDQNGKYIYTNLGVDKVDFSHFTFGLSLDAFLW